VKSNRRRDEEMHTGGIVASGIVLMPIVASTVACLVTAVLTAPVPHLLAAGGIRYGFLWPSALVVGIPASIIGSLVCAPLVTGYRGRPWHYALFCGLTGAGLGFVGFGLIWLILDSIRVGTPLRSFSQIIITSIMLAIAAITGFISGAIFAFATYLNAQTSESPPQ
jgi:hypothetical protein